MPYVSDGTKFVNLDKVEALSQLKAGSFFKPTAGTLPVGILTVGAFSATAQAFGNLATYLWNSGAFNTQGQRWVGVDGTPANGCRNEATARTSGGVRFNHIISTEFLYSGQALDIAFIGSSSYEIMVYLEREGQMYRAEATPKAGTTTGLMHLPLNFAAYYHGRIRVVLAGGLLVGVKCEQSAIVKKSPDRIACILDGSEWTFPEGFKQASGISYLSLGLAQYMFEETGFVWINRGYPDTGYFRNGAATVTDDTATATNQTRFFSQNRKDWVEPDFNEKPLFYLIAGSRVDGGVSGATGVSNGPMALRVKACLDWIRTKDRDCKVVQMSVSPNGSGTGHDLNLAEQAFAVATDKRAEIIDAATWFNTTQRTALIGVDGVNPADNLFQLWASRIADSLAQMLVGSLRARRIR